MVWIDYAILAVIGLSSLISLIRGFVKEALSLVTWFAAFFVASRFFGDLAVYFTSVSDSMVRNGMAIAVLFVLPWLDRSPVKSMRYKGWMSKVWLWVFCISFVILGVLGVLAPTPGRTLLSQVCTFLYFAYFILMPFYTRLEKTKPVPERVTG